MSIMGVGVKKRNEETPCQHLKRRKNLWCKVETYRQTMPSTCNAEWPLPIAWGKIYWETDYIGAVDKSSYPATPKCQLTVAASQRTNELF